MSVAIPVQCHSQFKPVFDVGLRLGSFMKEFYINILGPYVYIDSKKFTYSHKRIIDGLVDMTARYRLTVDNMTGTTCGVACTFPLPHLRMFVDG